MGIGIESMNSMAGASSYQAPQPHVEKSPTPKNVVAKPADDTSDASSSSLSMEQVVVAKASQGDGTNNSSSDNEETLLRNEEKASEAYLKNAAKDINKKINNNTIAEFAYHEATHRITIKIKDKDTDKVIKEIPSEKALEMLEKAWELAGILVDEKR